MNYYKQLREEAIRWWNNLNIDLKSQIIDKYHPNRSVDSLTGREIQNIYDLFNN